MHLWMYSHAAGNIRKQLHPLIPLLQRSRWTDTLLHRWKMRYSRTKKKARLSWDRPAICEGKGTKLFIRCVPCRSSAHIGFSIAFGNRLIDIVLPLYSPSVTSNLIHSLRRRTNMSQQLQCVCFNSRIMCFCHLLCDQVYIWTCKSGPEATFLLVPMIFMTNHTYSICKAWKWDDKF